MKLTLTREQRLAITHSIGAAWADALEDAITEAEGGKDVDPRQPGPVSDADERAFWREVFVRSMPDRNAAIAADEADAALARYRKAFVP